MKDTTPTDMRLNIRQRRADTVLHEVMRIFVPYIKSLSEYRREQEKDCLFPDESFCDERELYREVADKLMKMLHAQGAEIVSDNIRQEVGLPPRGPDGWTAEELLALEQCRLGVLTKPFGIESRQSELVFRFK